MAALIVVSAFAQHVNGISFGPVKEYDERTLLERYQRLQSALLQVGYFYDRASLVAAIGKIQGASATSSVAQLGITLQLPVASFTNTGTNGTTGSTASNQSSTVQTGTTQANQNTNTATTQSGTTQSNQSSNTLQQAAVSTPTLTAPSVSSGLSFPSLSPQIGAADLLAEQTQLSYQLVNLSLLLDRSLTERIHLEASSVGLPASATTPRTLVVGFDVSILPKYPDAVAEIVIEATPISNKIEPIKVASLFPYEKTYNTATFTSKTSGFSLGTVFQVIGLTASQQNQNNRLYLARDLDVLGLHYDAPFDSGENPTTKFGWQFRPTRCPVRAPLSALSPPTASAPHAPSPALRCLAHCSALRPRFLPPVKARGATSTVPFPI